MYASLFLQKTFEVNGLKYDRLNKNSGNIVYCGHARFPALLENLSKLQQSETTFFAGGKEYFWAGHNLRAVFGGWYLACLSYHAEASYFRKGHYFRVAATFGGPQFSGFYGNR